MGVSETKLDDSFPHGHFHVDNYVLSRKDRTSHGGGVALYVRSDIPYRRRHDLENIIDRSSTNLEIVIMEVTMHTKDRWIYVVEYKPPGIKDLAFYDILSTMCELIPPWKIYVKLLIYKISYLIRLVSKKQNGSLIDLYLVSNPLRFKKALNLDCWLSDWHNFICITTKLSVPCQKPGVIMYRSSKNFVDHYFSCDLYHLLESLNFGSKYAINTCFKHFVDCLDDIVNYHAPWKRKPLGRILYPIWIVNSGKWCIKGTWCVISKINILVLKIMNGTESSETNV